MPQPARLGAAALARTPHPSSAPSWRVITETAACVMRMDEGLDTGPVCRTERVPIGTDMTAGELHDRWPREVRR
jgi:methionyl-tRNA formyltransferase